MCVDAGKQHEWGSRDCHRQAAETNPVPLIDIYLCLTCGCAARAIVKPGQSAITNSSARTAVLHHSQLKFCGPVCGCRLGQPRSGPAEAPAEGRAGDPRGPAHGKCALPMQRVRDFPPMVSALCQGPGIPCPWYASPSPLAGWMTASCPFPSTTPPCALSPPPPLRPFSAPLRTSRPGSGWTTSSWADSPPPSWRLWLHQSRGDMAGALCGRAT